MIFYQNYLTFQEKNLSPVKKFKKSLDAGVGVSRIVYEIIYAKRLAKEEI